MKRAKRIPFSARRKRRLSFSLINRSGISVPSADLFARWISAALCRVGHHAEISVMLCSEDAARTYNRDFRGKDYATNVLSFTLTDDADNTHGETPTVCGDLLICPQVVAREAAAQGKNLTAHYAHLTVHGTLHLAGFDHENEADAQIMEAVEIDVLNRLGYNNPYL